MMDNKTTRSMPQEKIMRNVQIMAKPLVMQCFTASFCVEIKMFALRPMKVEKFEK